MKGLDRHMNPRQSITIRSREIGDDGWPSSSWWTDCDRAEFTQRQRAEQRRMETSRFGQAVNLAQAPMAHDRPKKVVALDTV